MKWVYLLLIASSFLVSDEMMADTHKVERKTPPSKSKKNTAKPEASIKPESSDSDKTETADSTMQAPKIYRPRVNYHYRKTKPKEKKGIF